MRLRRNSLAGRALMHVAALGCGLAVLGAMGGCKSLKPKESDHYVYVTAKSATLRDRVAAVSNRTGEVANGDKLKVLEHGRHFIRVQTPKGEIGWIKEAEVATGETEGDFDKLKEEHKSDATVATAVVRDSVYMHAAPGKDAERFYLLAEGEKLQLLRRATLVKTNANPASIARAQKAIPQAAGSDARKKNAAPVAVTPTGDVAGPPPMEDWWLVRDSQGHTGWLYSRMMDVDAPEALTRYAEGQRFVGAYILTRVHDNDAPGGPADLPVYVTVLSPYKAGLPYDFDQVRVFTWSLTHHRYETGFREKNIEGYLPVTIGTMKDLGGKTPQAQEQLPSCSYKVLSASAPPVVPDPATGAMVPARTVTRTYRMEGNYMHRITVAGAPVEEVAHPAAEEKTTKKGKKK